jgi:PhoH-like ATPase
VKKVYVLDTNVLLGHPASLDAFDDNDLIIPMIVLEELDRQKNRQDEVGRNAREVNRQLDALREKGSLFDGIKLDSGGSIRVVSIEQSALSDLPLELRNTAKTDNLLLAFMKQQAHAILVSRDINIRVKCDALNIRCEDYKNLKIAQDVESIYKGVITLQFTEEQINEFYEKGGLIVDSDLVKQNQLYPNEIVVMKCTMPDASKKSAIARFMGYETRLLKPTLDVESCFGLRPRNKEQKFAFDLLLDENIKLVTLNGTAGVGKTLIALAAALEQLNLIGTFKRYSRLVITRPIQPMGKDIGFLPGSYEEKMSPWVAPIRDNLEFLLSNSKLDDKGFTQSRPRRRSEDQMFANDPYLSLMQEKGLIEVEAMSFIRGRSIPNSFIIVDECQNITVHELKTIITRAGEGTKIVLTGDICQIDTPYIDAVTNGLTYAIEKFKKYDITGHITLRKGERSKLATLASDIL